MKRVTLYTDGACSGNPGPGGWAAVLIYGAFSKEISGGDESTTNNKMELTAVIKGLETLKEPCEVDVFSDSTYVVNAFTEHWIEGWISRGWKNVKNKELWDKLISLVAEHKVRFNKVKGHSDNELNNRCDELARAEIKKLELDKI